MKLLFSLLFVVISFKSLAQTNIVFTIISGKCQLDDKYLHLPNNPVLRVKHFIYNSKDKNLLNNFWLAEKYKYYFEFDGNDLFFVKFDFRKSIIIWSRQIQTLKYTKIK